MSAEDRPGQSGDEQRELVHMPESQLAIPETQAIATRLGFGVELFPKLMRVNDALKRLSPKPESMRVVMIPGESPRFETSVAYTSKGYQAMIEGNGKMASFVLGTIEDVDSRFFMLKWPDIQAFVGEALPNKKAVLRGLSSIPLEREHFELAEEFEGDLLEVTEDELKQKLRTQEKVYQDPRYLKPSRVSHIPYEDFEVKIQGQKEPFMKLGFFMGYDPYAEVRELLAFPLYRLQFDGTAHEVEALMDKLPTLIDKPRLYPFTERKNLP